MKLTFLGTGTSQGVPVIACTCPVCQSKDEKDKRLRTSVLIEVDDRIFVIDSGPDFRYQMLRAKVPHLNGILFTHEHKDHTAGLDDIRAFNWVNKAAVDVYAEKRVQEALKKEFSYVFAEQKYPGIPELHLWEVKNEAFRIDGVTVLPIRAMHLKLPVFGYRIGDLTYITDANYIAPEEMEKIRGSKVLVINALRKEKHISHFTLGEALKIIEEVKPEKAFLTHISHQMGFHEAITRELPPNVELAYDGLELTL
ncbi:MAG: MBL fold metallo-hydrolase [Marinifilaceae bacterium]